MSSLGAKKLLLAGSGFEPEARALFLRMSVPPNFARKRLISRTIRDMKRAGIWSKMRILYLFAAHHSQASLLNWTAPGFNAVLAGAQPTLQFGVDDAIRLRGLATASPAYLETACPVGSGVATASSTHASMLFRTISESEINNTGDMSASTNNAPLLMRLNTLITQSQLYGDALTGIERALVPNKLYIATKSGTTGKVILDGAVQTTTNGMDQTSTGGTVNLLNSLNNSYTGWCRAASYGAGLTNAEAASFNTIIKAYLAGLAASA